MSRSKRIVIGPRPPDFRSVKYEAEQLLFSIFRRLAQAGPFSQGNGLHREVTLTIQANMELDGGATVSDIARGTVTLLRLDPHDLLPDNDNEDQR